MSTEHAITTFEEQSIRRFFDEMNEMWYFSVIDVVAALTDSVNPRDYWFKMKIRVKTEDGLELSTICRQLKMKAADGKKKARLELESKTGKSVITSENYLPPVKKQRQIKQKLDNSGDKE